MGLNGGVHDAYNLAEKLIAVINDGAPASLLGRYERQRRKVALDVVQQTTLRNRAILNTRERLRPARPITTTCAPPSPTRSATRPDAMRTSIIQSLRDVATID